MTLSPQVRANPEKFSGDLSRGFLAGGVSAGANLAAVVSHLARDDPEFEKTPLTGIFLQIPSICFVNDYPEELVLNLYETVEPSEKSNLSRYKHVLLSHKQNEDAPILSNDLRLAFMGEGLQASNIAQKLIAILSH